MEVSDYLKTEIGIESANSFIKAIRERRVFSVTRKCCAEYDYIDFYKIDAGNYYPYCLNSFLEQMGFKICGKGKHVRVNGGNMDLSNHAIYDTMRKLKDNGFDADVSFPNINRL